MSTVEWNKVLSEIASGNASPMDMYNRQKRRGEEYDEQRAALRRVLRRFMQTDTPPDNDKIAAQLQPAAEKALRDAARKIEKEFNK